VLEIYCEELHDLLKDKSANEPRLEIREDSSGAIHVGFHVLLLFIFYMYFFALLCFSFISLFYSYFTLFFLVQQIPTLTHKKVCSHVELLALISSAAQKRIKYKTNVHADSSRSHFIVTL
jgi:hypothetical protein